MLDRTKCWTAPRFSPTATTHTSRFKLFLTIRALFVRRFPGSSQPYLPPLLLSANWCHARCCSNPQRDFLHLGNDYKVVGNWNPRIRYLMGMMMMWLFISPTLLAIARPSCMAMPVQAVIVTFGS